MRTSDHVNLSNRLRVRLRPLLRNYAVGSTALAGDDSGNGSLTRSIKM